jgi:sporulation protein YlmC with PRC-barrel domain
MQLVKWFRPLRSDYIAIEFRGCPDFLEHVYLTTLCVLGAGLLRPMISWWVPARLDRTITQLEDLSMYANIISAVSQFLTPELIGKMGSVAGISDRTVTQNAVGAAVPAILSGLANLASKPEGARQLSDAIAKQSPPTLGNLASVGQLADTGKSLLSSLLGIGSFGGLANTLARFVGAGDGGIRSLLGMLTPVILGVLGREAGAGANGLTQLLASQKDSFAAAMPTGFSDLLKTSGFFDRAGAPAAAASRVHEPYRAARDAPDAVVHAMTPARSTASSSNWMYWALPVLALAGLGWYLLSGDRTDRPVAVVPQPAVPRTTAQGTDLQSQVASAIDSLSGTLQGVKDRAKASEMLPRLQQSVSELDRLNGLASQLPVESRDRLAEAIKAGAARVKTTLDNVGAMPDVAPDVRPVVAALRSKLDSLAMTPGSVAQQRIGLLADKGAYLARSPDGAVSIGVYLDRNVYNRAGETVGSVHDLIVGSDGKIAAAVLGVGGFLGIGEKEIAVPFSAIQATQRDNDWHLVVEATKEALKDAPAYTGTGPRVHFAPGSEPTRK